MHSVYTNDMQFISINKITHTTKLKPKPEELTPDPKPLVTSPTFG